MVPALLVLCGLIAPSQAPAGPPAIRAGPAAVSAGAAERITLRDGSVVLGLITTVTTGPRGSLELLVRRDWAREHLPRWGPRWERAVEGGTRLAARQRAERLAAWRRQRARSRPDGDRILAWIDAEQRRLEDPDRLPPSRLIPVRLSRGDVREIARQPQANQRLLQLGWLCGLPDVETARLETLQGALEARGFAVNAAGDSPSLGGLLPLVPEPELTWLARRAATELAVDSDLRFIRHQNLVLPDTPPGQAGAPDLGGLNLSTALGELGQLLGLEPARREDPLVAVFRKVGESGRVGAVVTRLELSGDLSQAAVETTLWVQARPEQWIPYLSRSSVIRSAEVGQDAGQDLAEDPQVKSAFALVEALGLGKVDPALKERSLRMGAATQHALGTARAAMAAELNRLMLPVFDGHAGPAGPVKAGDAGRPPGPGSEVPGPKKREGGAGAPGHSP
jgi:hypothetical protein